MTAEALSEINRTFLGASPGEIVRWAVGHAGGRAIVSTNFRPYEVALLHAVAAVQPDMPVLWVDHGFNRPATYRYAELLRGRLGLNIQAFHPRLSAAHYEALHGPPPSPGDEPGLRRFSALMKIEPFQRGLKALAPSVWITGLRRVQNPHRAQLDVAVWDANFGVLKVSPFFHQSDADLEAYVGTHALPNEWDYYDPAKADEKRECGLHKALA